MVAFTKLSLRGLGYRSFIDQSNLYLLLGMSHYYKLRVPNKIFLAKRRQTLFLWSTSPSQITSFVIKLRQLRSLSFYKEKGVLPNVE